MSFTLPAYRAPDFTALGLEDATIICVASTLHTVATGNMPPLLPGGGRSGADHCHRRAGLYRQRLQRGLWAHST